MTFKQVGSLRRCQRGAQQGTVQGAGGVRKFGIGLLEGLFDLGLDHASQTVDSAD